MILILTAPLRAVAIVRAALRAFLCMGERAAVS